VVLGHPEPVVAQLLDADGEPRGVTQGVTRRGAGLHRSKVKNRQRYVDHLIMNLRSGRFLPARHHGPSG
jgi:hypothetical protein